MESFSYSDAGISLNINLAQGYQGVATTLLAGYNQQRENLKRSLRPKAASIKSGQGNIRIRSYAPRQWTMR